MTAGVLVMPELDERDREEQRYAAYEVKHLDRSPHEMMSTPTLEGVGRMLALLRNEGEITDDTRVGILDRVDRKWIVNPFAKGAR